MKIPMFDISPILTECRAYIDTLDNFEVKILGEIKVEGNDTTQYFNLIRVKEHLIEFLFKCELEASIGRVSLIQYLKEFGALWGENRAKNLNWLQKQIVGSTANWRIEQLKNTQEQYIRFHEFNYNIITLLRCRVMDIPLPDHLIVEPKHTLPGETKITGMDQIGDSEPQISRSQVTTEKKSAETIAYVLNLLAHNEYNAEVDTRKKELQKEAYFDKGNSEMLGLLRENLSIAEKEIKTCLNWWRIIDQWGSLNNVAIELLSLGLRLPDDDSNNHDNSQNQLHAYQKAYVWKEFADWLKQEMGSYQSKISLDLNTSYSSQNEIAIGRSSPVKTKDSRRLCNENTQRKARQAVTQFERLLTENVVRERGKNNPLLDNDVAKKAIQEYTQLTGLNLATTEKGLSRYLSDIGKDQTALEYGRQLVGQLRHRN